MMIRAFLTMLLFALAAPVLAQETLTDASVAKPPLITVLAFHDVRTDAMRNTDPDAITPDAFIGKLEWLAGNGWTFVSLDQVRAARAGGAPLPAKAVLLTFDDGLKSAYTTVFPILKAYHAPAVMALVDQWINLPAGTTMDYNGEICTRDCFVSWAQVREMDRSGLIEIASHSDNLHQGIEGDPQGSLTPMARTVAYQNGQYETQAQFEGRVRTDMQTAQATLTRELGHRVRAIAWPYGAYTAFQVAIAQREGMLALGLSADAPASLGAPVLERILVGSDMETADMADMLTQPRESTAVRALQISMSLLDGATAAEQEARLSLLLDRAKRLRPSEVWVTGMLTAQGSFVPTRIAPTRHDIAGRDAWQLRTRAGIGFGLIIPPMDGAQLLPYVFDAAAHISINRILLEGHPSPALQAQVLAILKQWHPAATVDVIGAGPRAKDVGTVLELADAPATQRPDLTHPVLVRVPAQPSVDQARQVLEHTLGRGYNQLVYTWDNAFVPGDAWQGLRPAIATTAYPYQVP